MDGAHALLIVLLGLDVLQGVVAVAAIAHGGRRRRREEHQLARYSFRHAGLLLAGAVVLAIPIVLGLSGAIAARTALWIVLSVEIVGIVVARAVLERLHAAAQRG